MEVDQRNTIPTAVVLAFYKGCAKFEAATQGKNFGRIVVSTTPGPKAEIVDGQHRLFGMNEFDPQTEVAVVALLDADEVEKAFQFLVINNKSSRVPVTHAKALIAKMKNQSLVQRLEGARIAFDTEGVKDADLINNAKESPFFQTIDWPTTPREKRMVQATAIEFSLSYIEALDIADFEDRDTRRAVFLSIWSVIKRHWAKIWKPGSRLISKVGIICLTRFVADLITKWADNEDLGIDLTNLDDISTQTLKIISKMDVRFWTTPWADKAQGGFDTAQGRDRVNDAITKLYRNGKDGLEWFTDIDIIDHSGVKE